MLDYFEVFMTNSQLAAQLMAVQCSGLQPAFAAQLRVLEINLSDAIWAQLKKYPQIVEVSEDNMDWIRHHRPAGVGVFASQVATCRHTFDVDEPDKTKDMLRILQKEFVTYFELFTTQSPNMLLAVDGPKLYMKCEAYMGECFVWADTVALKLGGDEC
jgi:hypothetical protein